MEYIQEEEDPAQIYRRRRKITGLFFTSFDIYYPGHKLILNTDQLEQTNNASDSWYLCDW